MYQEILLKLGLNANEAHIYELLLTKGRTKARDLLTDSGLGRGNLYNVLTGLVARGLATVTEGKQQIYEAAEPSKLSGLVDDQKRQTDRLAQEFQGELPKLLSTFNLTTGKPTVRIFEGLSGFEESLAETLLSKEEILAYIDTNVITDAVAEADTRYVHTRIKQQVSKRIIVSDNEASHKYIGQLPVPFTTTAFISNFPDKFGISVQIYGDNVLFLSIDNKKILSVIIHDKRIAAFHRQMFEYHWQLANEVMLPPVPQSK